MKYIQTLVLSLLISYTVFGQEWNVSSSGNTFYTDKSVNIGAAGGSTLHVRHIDGKDYQSYADDDLFLNWGTGDDVHIGRFNFDLPSNILVSGKVGVGITDPQSIFHAKSSNPVIILQDSDSNSYATTNTSIKFNNGYATVGQIVQTGENLSMESTGSVSSLSFKTNKKEQIRLTNVGNVGIGTTAPSEKLEVKGNLYVNSGINDNKIHWNGHNMTMGTRPGAYTHNVFHLKPGGASQGMLFSKFLMYNASAQSEHELKIQLHSNGNSFINSGSVGIGTTAPTEKLEVRGNVKINTNSSYSTLRLGKESNDAIIADNKGDDYYGGGYWFRVHDESLTHKYRDVMMLSDTGNVGIGATDPKEKLYINEGNIGVKGYNTSRYIRFSEDGYQGSYINYDGINNILNIGVHQAADSNISSDTNIISIGRASGNVGIGTTTPKSKLHVLNANVNNGHYLNTANVFEASDSRVQILSTDSGNASSLLFLSNAPEVGDNKHWSFHHTGVNRNDRLEIGYSTSTANGDFWDLSPKMTISTDGDVGIGTTDTKGFKLGVNGNIAATKVKVALYNNWPDYVFEEAYELPTLKEVEAHINEKGHLQNVPSAEEVAKNGFFLEEMNAKLLQKIEELTLYTIAQEKEIWEFEAYKSTQDKKMELLIKRLVALEAK